MIAIYKHLMRLSFRFRTKGLQVSNEKSIPPILTFWFIYFVFPLNTCIFAP